MGAFREKILEAVRDSKEEDLPELDLPGFDDEEEQGQPTQEVEQKEEVSSPTQEPEPQASPQSVAPSLPSADDSWRKEMEAKLEASNAQFQMLLGRLVDKASGAGPIQHVPETGVQQGEDPYFVTKQDIPNIVKPLADKIQQVASTAFTQHERWVVEDFNRTERMFKEKYGDDFDKYVSKELREKALAKAREDARKGAPINLDWSAMFDYDYKHNSHADLQRQLAEYKQKEELKAKQEEELKKVAAMPKGTTAHQAPAAPKLKPGESRSDAFRNAIKKAWKGFAE